MAFTNSLSALELKLEIYEVEALIEWHRDNQYRKAERGAYNTADTSQQRADQLFESLTQHRRELEAERVKRLAARSQP